MAIGGLDIGTSGCKVTLFRDDGVQIAAASENYSANISEGRCELDARLVWKHVKSILSKVAQMCDEQLEALSVTTIGETIVAVDMNGEVLAPSILYTDPRGKNECAELIEKFGGRTISAITGAIPHEMYTLPKLMWMQRHTNQIQKAAQFFLFQDYFVWKLCGVRAISPSIAARTMAFDIRKKQWSTELLSEAGIDITSMSSVVSSGTVVGTIHGHLARELGISPNLQIVLGAHDQACAALGAGVLEPGICFDGNGTCECIAVPQTEPPMVKGLEKADIACVPHAVGDGYLLYLLVLTCGSMMNWYQRFLSLDGMRGNWHQKMEEKCKNGPSGLLVLPQFSASGTPHLDFSAKGAIWGLDLETTKEDVYQAMLEGTAYQMKMSLELLESKGIITGPLYATGGGASSKLWLQMKADIMNREVFALENHEAGTVGGMMLAALALGKYKSFKEACRDRIKLGDVYIPRSHYHLQYEELFKQYKAFYQAVEQMRTGKENKRCW